MRQAGGGLLDAELLQLGIVLMGLQLTAAQVAAVGVSGILIAATFIATFLFTKIDGLCLVCRSFVSKQRGLPGFGQIPLQATGRHAETRALPAVADRAHVGGQAFECA